MQSLGEGPFLRSLHPRVRCSISHSSQDTEAAPVSMDRRVGEKTWSVCKWDYSAVRQRKPQRVATWMD